MVRRSLDLLVERQHILAGAVGLELSFRLH
jgi:hypothetical protein